MPGTGHLCLGPHKSCEIGPKPAQPATRPVFRGPGLVGACYRCAARRDSPPGPGPATAARGPRPWINSTSAQLHARAIVCLTVRFNRYIYRLILSAQAWRGFQGDRPRELRRLFSQTRRSAVFRPISPVSRPPAHGHQGAAASHQERTRRAAAGPRITNKHQAQPASWAQLGGHGPGPRGRDTAGDF
jgi:hypothetical protein